MTVQWRSWTLAAALALLAASCATKPKPEAQGPADVEIVLPPTITRGQFDIEADKLDTWNAVGHIVVNTPGVEYEGRSQMLDMYTLRYRGVEFLVLTKALLLSDTIRKTTTRVTATTAEGKPIDTGATADLLAMLQEKLPEAIKDVQVRQQTEAEAKKQKAKKKSKKKKK